MIRSSFGTDKAVQRGFTMNQILVVMQGPSGGGKSTLANGHIKPLLEALGHTVRVCSTDDQFKVDGVYRFDPSKLATYHAINQKLVIEALERGESVIVDNTNLARWEAKPYVQAAHQRGIPVTFHRVDGMYKNVHGVPDEKVEQMRSRLEPLTLEGCLGAKSPWEK
jgi:predicted kinase